MLVVYAKSSKEFKVNNKVVLRTLIGPLPTLNKKLMLSKRSLVIITGASHR